MSNKQSRLTNLRNTAAHYGLYIYTYSPGDGVTRYRFSKNANSDYFACYPNYIALGISEAEHYVAGFINGYYARDGAHKEA